MAEDGDVVLVDPGTYGHFGVIGKGVSVIATGDPVVVNGLVRVQGAPSTSVVTLAGLTVQGADSHALLVYGCDGAVRVQSCSLTGGSSLGQPSGFSAGMAAVRAEDASDVALTGCTLRGGAPVPVPWSVSPSGPGLVVVGSTSTVEGCTVVGAAGGWHDPGCIGCAVFGDGAAGATVEQLGILVARGSLVRGGAGASGAALWETCGSGGPGIALESGCEIRRLDTVVQGGLPGAPAAIGGSPGSWGAAISGTGTVTSWSGSAPSLVAPSLVVEGPPQLVFEFAHEPGRAVHVLVSHHAGRRALPALRGDLLVGLPLAQPRWIVGTTDGQGRLQWVWTAPSVPLGETLTLHIQAGFVAAGGDLVLGPSHVLTVLDSSL